MIHARAHNLDARQGVQTSLLWVRVRGEKMVRGLGPACARSSRAAQNASGLVLYCRATGAVSKSQGNAVVLETGAIHPPTAIYTPQGRDQNSSKGEPRMFVVSKQIRLPLWIRKVGVEERCPPRQMSRVERLHTKLDPLFTSVTVETRHHDCGVVSTG